MLTKQDLPTYNRIIKILKKFNNNENYYVGNSWEDIDETEQNIRIELAKLKKIRGFPIEKDEGYIYRFVPDFIGLLSEQNIDFIASSIAIHKLNSEFDYITGIKNILKSLNYGLFALPLRADHRYKEIEDFESYELSYCIANEMAIRNNTIENKIRKYHYINDLLSKLSFKKLGLIKKVGS